MAATFVSRSEAKTAALARKLSQILKPGDVIFLKGELGSGKTFFIREAAGALGITEPVTSPSFAMGQTYSGPVTVHHLDLYRLETFGNEDLADFEPFFAANAITFIEWPEGAEAALPRPAIEIFLEHASEHGRRVTLSSPDPRRSEALERLIDQPGD